VKAGQKAMLGLYKDEMRISTLKLLPFRCHTALTIEVPVGADVVGVVGPNGSGKTSVLEALALLAPGRGLSGNEPRTHTPFNQKEWGFFAELANATEVAQQFRNGVRKIEVDGHSLNADDLGTLGSVVALTPHTDFLFSGPPEARRRWLDDAVTALKPAHAQAVARYRTHRQGRLKILAQGIMNGDWLEAEERLAAQWGIKLMEGRQEYLSKLRGYLDEVTLTLQGGALEVLSAEDPIAALQGKFERSRDIDARLNRTHAGPNTLDVAGTLSLEENTVPLVSASSGQHKRALLGWVRAHTRLLAAERGAPPLVLIDEFAAHLDAKRREDLLAHLLTLGCQVWLADVELPEVRGLHKVSL
jgi:DNA replication and repair protein RecF